MKRRERKGGEEEKGEVLKERERGRDGERERERVRANSYIHCYGRGPCFLFCFACVFGERYAGVHICLVYESSSIEGNGSGVHLNDQELLFLNMVMLRIMAFNEEEIGGNGRRDKATKIDTHGHGTHTQASDR